MGKLATRRIGYVSDSIARRAEAAQKRQARERILGIIGPIRPRDPAKADMLLAMMEDGIGLLFGAQGRLHEHTLQWLRSTDPEWPFSFRKLCDALGVNADELMQRVYQAYAAAPEVAHVRK